MPPRVFGTKAPSWGRTGSVAHLWIPHLALLCLTCFLPGICKVVSIQASLNSTVVLPCHHAITPNESLGDYRVYWQMGDIVVHAMMEGHHEVQNRSERYLNCTSLDHSNFSLSLSGVRPSDEGSYSCHIQKKAVNGWGFESIHADYSVLLSVTAAYSQPVISQAETPDNTCCVNLTCSSHGGYPLASLVWYNLTGEHVIPEFQQNNSSLQDNVSHLYSVTSWLLVEVSTCLVVCAVQSQRLPALNSSRFTPDRCKPVPDPPKNNTAAIVAGSLVLIVFLAVPLLVFRFSRQSNERPSYAAPAEQRRDNSTEEATL